MKGKKFGVASSGSTGDTIARGLFSEYGLDPDKDVNIIAVGVGAQATAALKTGAVDALVSYEPDVTQMVDSGAGHIVFDLRTTTEEQTYSQLPTSALQATKKWIDANPDTAAALVKAISKASDVLRNDPDTALPVLEKLYPDLDADAVKNIYQAAQTHFSTAIPEQTYDDALKIYEQSGLVTDDDAPAYQDVVATQFKDDWTS
jgi:NitT/TauT family transport system substrate-binding protein